MKKPVLAVIGHGMVSHYFLQQLVERELHQHYDIVVFGEERLPAYDRVHLSEYFAGRSAESLSLVNDGFFADNGITLHCASKIVAIDSQQRCVRDAQGVESHYDTLVLATGSYAFVPPISGNTRPGCLVYRTLDDLDAIAAQAKNAKRGVVIGGGLLGLEAANALRQLGLETHVVEFAPRLMAVQLDEGGAMMLQRKIEALGVQVHTRKETREIIDGEQARHRLCFADGSFLETDLLLFSAGIRPRDELAESAGLQKGPRGGIVIDDHCQTSDEAIYAIGECALWNGQIFGLVAPGYQMARSVADKLAARDTPFTGADMSTKLKLLGVEVASIGDAHGKTAGSQSYQWTDGPREIYKKIVVSADGKRLLGAVLIGDSADYSLLLQMMLNDMPLPAQPQTLILPALSGDAPKGLGVAALAASAQICSCHNVSKGDIAAAVAGGCSELGALKSCTKAGTGCGGCVPLLKQVMEHELQQLGVEVKKDICEHFAWSRQELYHLIRLHDIRTFDALIAQFGQGHGCEVCKPLVGSMLASCWNDYLLKPQHLPLQDTNDRFFANIQKDGTYSVVPRIPAGEITPQGLIAIGEVAQRYNLYTKITGGQRVDLFGARLEQLPAIWEELIAAGFETGHAYGKSLRTVKSCVGSTWCRYGVQDSTGMAIALENRYKGLRSPHKIKMAVSGCTRECAEAQGKDIGVIATDKGWNLYVCGNGGMKPRHADLFASDLDSETLIRTIDRVLMFYIRTADRLQRTSTWLDNMEGGLAYLKQVVLEDSLDIGAELERDMQQVVDSYQCEWKTTLDNPQNRLLFRGFLNSDQPDEAVVMVPERGQIRPATAQEKPPVQNHSHSGDGEWQQIAALADIPVNAGMAARLGQQQIALFHLAGSEPQVFALENHEPGSQANVLARGLVGDAGGEPMVISPLYKKRFRLRDGQSLDDAGLRLRVWPVKILHGQIWVQHAPAAQNTFPAIAEAS
ncbi:nitrite reductase large subunit NirB [Kosakonia pseudosacchari]|uniref:nitrite reductase large subunit NirB n=1 Tax=Kosakonia pseudosacchari TaxID=1646340 RepID=UPI0022F11D9D|nr:nitrite reductase large subunit NirB [Kosakonia pseudosacchari]WBU50291.1 nitrite reductase large subunit NirB [Kosakonia pseudosacchari]